VQPATAPSSKQGIVLATMPAQASGKTERAPSNALDVANTGPPNALALA
jgi:hypothetical protein